MNELNAGLVGTSLSSLTLGIDTSGDLCSVSLMQESTLLASSSTSEPRTQARLLVPTIRELMEQAGIPISDIDLVAVAIGPGSYTGLRIGLSTAKGICYASGAKLKGVPTLMAIARPHMTKAEIVISAMHARADEYYVSAYSASLGDQSEISTIFQPQCLELNQIRESLQDSISNAATLALIGPGGAALQATLPDAVVIDYSPEQSISEEVARCGNALMRLEGEDSLNNLEPSYLKPFVAKVGKPIFTRLREKGL